MLAANIETRVEAIIHKHGRQGWMRVKELAEEYAEDPLTGIINPSQVTRFYRWRKKVEKQRIPQFKILKLPGNKSWIGLKSADPRAIESFISEDKGTARSVKSGFGFFKWLNARAARKNYEKDLRLRRLQAGSDIIRLKHVYAVKHGRLTTEKAVEIEHEVKKKYGLFPTTRIKRKHAKKTAS